jgi:hypothetical protein
MADEVWGSQVSKYAAHGVASRLKTGKLGAEWRFWTAKRGLSVSLARQIFNAMLRGTGDSG